MDTKPIEPKRVRVVCLAGTRGTQFYVTGHNSTNGKFTYTGDPTKGFRFASARADEITERINKGGKYRATVRHEDDLTAVPAVTIQRRQRRAPRPTVPFPFLTSFDGRYKMPAVTLGEPKPLPEKRDDVVLGMLTELDTKDVFRQNFTNGEFVSRSLIVGKTAEAVADRKLDLDGAGYTSHYDDALKIYWREGGCFD